MNTAEKIKALSAFAGEDSQGLDAQLLIERMIFALASLTSPLITDREAAKKCIQEWTNKGEKVIKARAAEEAANRFEPE